VDTGGKSRPRSLRLRPVSESRTASADSGLEPALAREIVGRILAITRPQRVILFGSRARGDADPRSDIDVAVAGPAMTREEWLRVLASLEAMETLLPIQAVRLEEAPERLRQRIHSEGVELYVQPEARR
jgi:predicted nucleotidyltransferase